VFGVAPQVEGQVRAGTLRALALASPERSPALPGVPTAAEQGLRGFEAVLNYGVVAPAGTPADAINRLNVELNALLRADGVKSALATKSVTPVPGSPGQYAAVIAGDFEKWGEVIRKSGARVD